MANPHSRTLFGGGRIQKFWKWFFFAYRPKNFPKFSVGGMRIRKFSKLVGPFFVLLLDPNFSEKCNFSQFFSWGEFIGYHSIFWFITPHLGYKKVKSSSRKWIKVNYCRTQVKVKKISIFGKKNQHFLKNFWKLNKNRSVTCHLFYITIKI